MKEDIKAKLAAQITKDLLRDPNRVLAPHEPLISSGIIDSFNMVDLAVYAEDTFGVHLDNIDLNADRFDTLDQLAELIASRMR